MEKGPLPASLKPIDRSCTLFSERPDGDYFRLWGHTDSAAAPSLICGSTEGKTLFIGTGTWPQCAAPVLHWSPGHSL